MWAPVAVPTFVPSEDYVMTSLETAEQVVAQLPPAELTKFREWFERFDGEMWDAQIDRPRGSRARGTLRGSPGGVGEAILG